MPAKRTVTHRPTRPPPRSLSSPKLTHHKLRCEGQCRLCLRRYDVRPLTRHHLVPVSWFVRQPLPLRGVRNAHANVVPLCRVCHDLVESRDPVERRQARRYLRRSLSQQEVAFVIAVAGRAWLDDAYPT